MPDAPLDPDSIEAVDGERQSLRQVAAMAADFWDDCRRAGLPDVVANQMVIDWHAQVISPYGVEWSEDE